MNCPKSGAELPAGAVYSLAYDPPTSWTHRLPRKARNAAKKASAARGAASKAVKAMTPVA